MVTHKQNAEEVIGVSKAKKTNSEKPWFRKVKNTWYAWREGKQVSLGVKGEENYEAAKLAFYRLMATGERSGELDQLSEKNQAESGRVDSTELYQHHVFAASTRRRNEGEDMMMTPEEMEAFERRMAERIKSAIVETNTTKATATTVQQLVDGFLKDKRDEISQEAWRGYAKFLNPFAAKFGTRHAETITAEEAEDYTKKTEWSSTYRANFLGTLVSLYRWGVRRKLLTSSPVEGIRKPHKASRGTKAVISEAEHKKLLEHADDDFQDLLVLLWHTGARPGEITSLTAEQVKTAADGVIPLDQHKTSHKGKPRFLYLQGEAWEVAKRRADMVGTGLLFTGQNGKLTPKAVSAKMERLCSKAGTRRVIAYGYRHSYATQALSNGLPDAQVAGLLGHSDTSMLHKHYSHLTAQSRAMREAAMKVRP